MDHEPNVSDMWDMINAIEKIAQDDLNDVIPPWQREGFIGLELCKTTTDSRCGGGSRRIPVVSTRALIQ